MKPPVERVKVSAKGRDILIKIKRNTGLEHWNEICRLAFCHSLVKPSPPPKRAKVPESNIDIDWKTFAGQLQEELTALTLLKAHRDGVDIYNKPDLLEYFRDHLEHGINLLTNTKNLSNILMHKHDSQKE
ncbi:MAG: DNA sulfur modification protein DndE [Trichloromonadaceae bacterium]